MSYECKVEKKCGGCQYLHLTYEEQLKKKQNDMRKLLGGFGEVMPMIGMEQPLYYRHKVTATFDRDRKGNIISGIYEEKTHHVVQKDTCLLENEKANAIINTIRGMCKSFKIRTYDEDSGYGLLRHVMVRIGGQTGEIMVILVTADPVFPSKNNFVRALRKEHPEITTVVQNINDKHTSMVLGARNVTLYGPGFIYDTLCGKRFRISPASFYQVNPAQTEVLYKKALEFADFKGNETIMDAYCGTGTIGIIASDCVKEVIGVELNRDAVKDAVLNAKTNQCRNIRFYTRDAGEFIMQMADQGAKLDAVIMDPPRSGSSEAFLDAIGIMKPEKVIYVSCNPETLARDLAVLKKKGYRVKKMQPVDMFGFTGSVETVCLLVRKDR